jgi:hypothetical protein
VRGRIAVLLSQRREVDPLTRGSPLSGSRGTFAPMLHSLLLVAAIRDQVALDVIDAGTPRRITWNAGR